MSEQNVYRALEKISVLGYRNHIREVGGVTNSLCFKSRIKKIRDSKKGVGGGEALRHIERNV